VPLTAAGLCALADHLEQALPSLATELLSLSADADAKYAEREDAWAPVAAAVSACRRRREHRSALLPICRTIRTPVNQSRHSAWPPTEQAFLQLLCKLRSCPQRPPVCGEALPQACSICRVTDEDFMLGVAAIITLSTPLVLGLVALLRGRPEDYPEILRALFRRKEKKR